MLLSVVLHVAVAPQEHRVDHRSGRSFETCDTPLRPRGPPGRGTFARLSWNQEFLWLRIYYVPSGLDRTWLGLPGEHRGETRGAERAVVRRLLH